MLKSFLTFGCIVVMILFVYSYKMRQRIYNNNISCKVVFLPKKDNIYTEEEEPEIRERDLRKENLRENSYQKK